MKPLFEQAITSGMPGNVLGSGWWLKAFESSEVTGELRTMCHAVLRAGVRLEFELWPRVYDTQPIVCTVKPRGDSEAAATLEVGLRGPEIVRQIRYRIPTKADLERCIAWAWLDSLPETESGHGSVSDLEGAPANLSCCSRWRAQGLLGILGDRDP